MAHKQSTQARWQQIINDQAQSSLSIKQYCQQRQLSVSGFYHWKARLSPEQATITPSAITPAADTPLFVPLATDAMPAAAQQNLSVELSFGSWFQLSWKR